MLRATIAVLLCMLLTPASALDWTSNGLLTNPAANTILAEQVAVGDNARMWVVMCSASVASTVVVEHRDAANLTTIAGHSQGFFIPANGATTPNSVIRIPIFDQERIRVRLNGAVTGGVWCSVLME